MARRSKFENSPPYGKISSSTLRPFPHRQETIACHLLIDTPCDNEDPPGLLRRSSNEILRNQRARTQLRKATAGDYRRGARMGSGKDHQFPTPRTIQEAPIPRSMERVPTVRRFLGSRVGSFRSRPDRRLLRHPLPRSSATVI